MIMVGSLDAEVLHSTRLLHETGSPAGCQVLGDVFGVLVQGLLAAFVGSTLLAKWYLEKPRRQFQIFCLDSSKQVFGAGAIHVMNMVCAMAFAGDKADHGDECAWYWTNIMIDTTVGVGICYGLLKLTERLFGYDTGHYGRKAATGIDWQDNPDYSNWAKQILVWGAIVGMMKLIVVIIMYLFAPFWVRLSILATHWIEDKQMRLVFVMIITPTVMNLFQFIVQDSFLKYQQKEGSKEEPSA